MTSLSLGSIIFARLLEKGYGKQKAMAISAAATQAFVSAAESWDECKSVDENMANMIGDITQTIAIAAATFGISLSAEMTSFILAEGLNNFFDFSFGNITEAIYNKTKEVETYLKERDAVAQREKEYYNNLSSDVKARLVSEGKYPGGPKWNNHINEQHKMELNKYKESLKGLAPYYRVPSNNFIKFANNNGYTASELIEFNRLMTSRDGWYVYVPEDSNLKLPNGDTVPFDFVCDIKNKRIMIDVSSPTVYESEGKIVFTISLNRALNEDLTLKLSTIDGSAIGDEDFEKIKDKEFIIKAGNLSQKFTIPVTKDGKYENKENFMLKVFYKEGSYKGNDLLEVLNPTMITQATILDFPQEECPTTPKPKINPISLDLPPSPVYPTTRNEAPTYGSNTPGGSWSGGGSWGPGDWTYHPSVPHKPSLPNVPYIECYNEPYLNSMMIVKLGGISRSLSALNYMSKDNSFNLSSPLIKDSLNSSIINNKTLNLSSLNSSSLNALNPLTSNLNHKALNSSLNLESNSNTLNSNYLNLNPSNSSLNHTDTSNPINTPNSTNSNKIYFDMNSDGFKERMLEWMNDDEAILVNDINKNGTIDNGTEILGNNYISNLTGNKSPDSYSLLKEFDKNKDGVIDIKDNSGLALWQDKNKNGITDKGELTYIGDDNSPIKSISVNPLDALLSAYDRNHDFKIDNKDTIYNYIYYKDNPDNTIDLYIYGDESAKSFLDFDTTNHTILTNQGIKKVNEIHFYEGELNLNNIANGDSLNNKLVGNSYANTLNGNAGDDILEGLDGNDTLDGGSGSDKLYGGQGNDTLIGGKGNDLLDGGSWDDRYLFSKGDGIDVITDSHGNDTIEFDDSIKLEDLIVKSNGKDLNISIKSNNTNHLSNQIIIKNYYGSGRIERVKFSDGKVLEVTDIISMMGTNKDDTIYLTNASQTIDAKDGKDTIYAGSGNNTIIGGKGDDKIFGSYGNDTYIYTKGDGSDIIQDSGGKDTFIVKGINSNEVKFLRSSNSLVLKFDDSNSITIANYFIDSNRIESFKFDDKDMVPNDIINSFITDGDDNIVGTDEGDILDAKGGDDSIVGLRGNDTLIGGDGDDKLYGNDGDDTLIGSAGSDYMDGGYGNDTYIYNIGDGNDKIYDGSGKDKLKFGEGISKDDLKFRKNKNTLFITIKGENTIEILNFFTKNGVIEEFIFSDESVMLSSDIAKLFSYSFSGKDTIYSQNGATLIGEKGDDVYIYQRGDGRVIIDDSFIESSITVDAGNDTLKLIGINRDDIVLTKYGNDMVIFIKDENGKTTSEQTICIKDFNDPLKGVETIEFDDKSTIEIDKNGRYPSVSFSSKSSYHFVYGSEDNDIKGANSSYTYDLGAGDDKIVASSYHDTIIGGIGNDVLEGGSGNDTYVFNMGDGRDIIFDTAGEDSIKFGDGISKDDIAIRVIGDTLYVGIKESGVKFSDYSDRITIRGWVSSSNRVEKFIFKNGETIDYNQIISMAGTDEDDTISTFQNSNDTINALGGDDTINSYDGDDTIDGGVGDDIIDGGLGNDTYIFKRGMGRDTITDGGGIDTIKVVDDVNISEVVYKRVGDDLVVYIDEDGIDDSSYKDGAIVKGWFKSISNRIEFIEFADGRVIKPEDITKFTNSNDNLTFGDEDNIIHALDGDDTIYAGGGNDKIYGGNGSDILYGGDGNDILDGGKGKDTLYGGKGNDTYLFGRGDGKDTIDERHDGSSWGDGNDTLEFKDGITPDDIVIYYENNQRRNLVVAIKEDGKSLNELSDKIILKDWYIYSYRIENFKFADGTTWNVAEIQKHINTDGNDTIYGINGYSSSYPWHNILAGGKGNDTLYGYDGNDTYLFNRGDGKDTIIDSDGTDTLRLGEGIGKSDVLLWLDGNNLVISISDSDTITINNHASQSSAIEGIYLSNGLYMDKSTIDRVVSDIRLFASENALSLNRDTLLASPNILNIISSSWQKDMTDFTPPLVLDLNGNGATSSSLAGSNVYFDYDGDGVREKTAWIESGDALLVYDKDRDGIISDGSELFGEYFKLSSGNYAKDGYEVLKEFDSDSNGIINKLDTKFGELLVWQDTNLNGITDSGELKSLSGLGITSIGLPTNANFSVTENGNIITNKSTFIQNGSSKEMKDIWFGVDLGDVKSSVRDDILYDYDFGDTNIDSTIYVDDIKMLTQSEIKELIISGGYTGVSTSGSTAKTGANSGNLTFENKWYKSDTLDTIYESSDGKFKESNGVVRDFVDAVNGNTDLKDNVDKLGNNSDTIGVDMDKILKDWVLGDNFLDSNSFLPPIVLDLNGNGTTSLSLDGTDAYFNYGGDFRRYKTAWIEKGDAILGIDINKDGIVNSAFEVFGNKTRLSDGSFAKDGYEALKEFDSNGDGVINESDDNFEKLVLWFDDGDAKGEAGELKTLSEAGISSISLTPKDHETLENGNKISFESSFTKDNGTDGTLRDVWFEVSSKQSITISSLSDEDEKKISVVENFKGARLTDYQRANPMIISQILDEYESIKYDMMSQILAKKLYGDNANTCTLLYSALNIKLSRVINGDATPEETALSINLLASVLKKDFTYAIFKLSPSYLSNEKIKALLDKTGINFSINQKDLNSIKGVIGKNVFGDDEAEIFDFSENKEGVNVLSKGGNDILMGSNFHDKLNGGNGNDIVIGNDGIDTIIGSGGNDFLMGGKDSTIYEYYLGDGDDIIYDDGGKDILKLNFLKISDLSVAKSDNDMLINIINPFEKDSIFGSITIKDGYKGGKIEEFFIGDKIYTFDEFLKVVPASNRYEFKKGSSLVEIDDKGGIDTLIFGAGITPKDIITLKNGLNLEIAIKMEGRAYSELLDKLIIKNFFTDPGEPNGVGKIESFIFESGIILSNSDILLSDISDDKFIIGDEKNNELVGTNNSNVINGKIGDDTLKGLLGDDTYIYESGKDIIIDSGGNDKLVFGEGITRDSLQSKFIGNDLIIVIKENGVKFEELKNNITIKNQALKDSKIEKIMYSDGSEFDIDTLKNRDVIADKTISKTLLDVKEINSLIKASDEDGDKLTFKLIEESKFGTLTLNSDGSYTYRANDKFIGEDSAKVKISDGMGSEVVTTINLSVKISTPIIDNSELKFNEDTILKSVLKVENPSNSKLTYELVGNSTNSSVLLEDDGSFIITPNLNFYGKDFITIKVTNEYGLSDIKTIPLNIVPINDAPEFKESISNYELTNTNKIVANLGAIDIDSSTLSYKVISNPANGLISIDESGNFTYISNKGYIGSDKVIVEVSDSKLSTTKELNFNIKGYEYRDGDLIISSDDLVDTTLKLPNVNVEDIKFNRLNDDLSISTDSGDITIKDYFKNSIKTVDTLIFKGDKILNISNENLVVGKDRKATLKDSGVIFANENNSVINGSNNSDTIISVGTKSKIYAKAGNDTIILNGDENEAYGSLKNDTLISNSTNSFLKGENGDDTYIIGKDANNTIIRDKEFVNLIDGGNDTLILNSVKRSSVEFKLGGSFKKDLIINYKTNSDETKTLTIENQTNKFSSVETIKFNDSTILNKNTIDKVIQELNSYSSDKGLNLDSFMGINPNESMIQIYQG